MGDALSEIVRSLMLCAAATSGANYNLLKSLREKRMSVPTSKETSKNSRLFPFDDKTKDLKENILKKKGNSESVSSGSSVGSMTVKSISTIGNIVGGLKKKRQDYSM